MGLNTTQLPSEKPSNDKTSSVANPAVEGKASPSRTGLGYRKFPISPVEGAIFAAVLSGFAYSVIGLFQEQSTFTALMDEGTTAPKSGLTQNSSPGLRSPASAGGPLSSGAQTEAERIPAALPQPSDAMRAFDFNCELTGEQAIVAGKVRISGPFCKAMGSGAGDAPLKTTLLNEANQFTATVFMDASVGRFSTDYIPLNSGSNPIQVEFRYANGSAVKKSFVLLKK
jgi:hypothetical protein